jgi:hypothetical protein
MKQRKPPGHKFIKKPARRNIINNISLSYRFFLQLLDLQRKKDKNSNKANRKGI